MDQWGVRLQQAGGRWWQHWTWNEGHPKSTALSPHPHKLLLVQMVPLLPPSLQCPRSVLSSPQHSLSASCLPIQGVEIEGGTVEASGQKLMPPPPSYCLRQLLQNDFIDGLAQFLHEQGCNLRFILHTHEGKEMHFHVFHPGL